MTFSHRRSARSLGVRLLLATTVLGATTALSACASIEAGKMEEIAASEAEYTTGSNIPRKKTQGNVATMSADTAEELRRMNEPRPVRN